MLKGAPVERNRVAVGLAAAVLAVAGMAVSAVGEGLGSRFLARGLGPALTLTGAGLWVFAKVAERLRRR